MVSDLQDVTFGLSTGGEGRGRLAMPAGEGPWPGVLVLHEIMGLNEDMDRIAGRFARAGYAALAPNFFGEGLRPFCILRAIAELRGPEAAKPGGPFEILSAAQSCLATQVGVDRERIGVVGFCMGGGFAVLHAARSEIGVVGTFYGDVPPQAEALEGIPPLVGGFGARDRIFGPGAERLKTHLKALDVTHDVRVYPTAGHSYMSPHNDWIARLGAMSPMKVGYHEDAAEDSWERMLRFFAEHLGAGGAAAS